jgi:hypothetical protein
MERETLETTSQVVVVATRAAGGRAIPAPAACANDNAERDLAAQPPVVVIQARSPEHAYARRENLILPLRFARRMAGWSHR